MRAIINKTLTLVLACFFLSFAGCGDAERIGKTKAQADFRSIFEQLRKLAPLQDDTVDLFLTIDGPSFEDLIVLRAYEDSPIEFELPNGDGYIFDAIAFIRSSENGLSTYRHTITKNLTGSDMYLNFSLSESATGTLAADVFDNEEDKTPVAGVAVKVIDVVTGYVLFNTLTDDDGLVSLGSIPIKRSLLVDATTTQSNAGEDSAIIEFSVGGEVIELSLYLGLDGLQDTDGDGRIDDVDNCPTLANTDQADMDHDGIGNLCDPDIDGDGELNVDDCAPEDNRRSSLLTEIVYNGIDDDCDAGTPDDDLDEDGYANAVDCDDADPDNWTSCATCLDQDTDSYYAGCDSYTSITGPDCAPTEAEHWTDCGSCTDSDADGYGAGCNLGLDCDDSVATGTSCYTGCATFYDDADGDSRGDSSVSVVACTAPVGYVADNTDCDVTSADHWSDCGGCSDSDADGYGLGCDLGGDCDDTPATGSSCYAGCSTYYLDSDGDNYGTTITSSVNCVLPAGYVLDSSDCDDGNASIPGAELDNGIDDDCDGDALELTLFDIDSDGYTAAYGASADPTPDCDDADPAAYPGAPEINYDAIDQDCDGFDECDVDGDGFWPDAVVTSMACAPGLEAGDCDDTDSLANPAGDEVIYDGRDNDCSADTRDDDLDSDGFVYYLDCDDYNPLIAPDQPEIPDDGIDQDCDGVDYTADLVGGVFVSAEHGSDDNTGAAWDPLKTINAAVIALSQGAAEIYIEGGVYDDAPIVQHTAMARIYGGYDFLSGWTRDIESFPTYVTESTSVAVFITRGLKADSIIDGLVLENQMIGHSSLFGISNEEGSSPRISRVTYNQGSSADLSYGFSYTNSSTTPVVDNSLVVVDSHIHLFTGSYQNACAIYAAKLGGGYIKGNKIDDLYGGSYLDSHTGIELYANSPTAVILIEKNKIVLDGGSDSGYGILAIDSPFYARNNLIYVANTISIGTGAGFKLQTEYETQAVHNTIYLENNMSGVGFEILSGRQHLIMNNILFSLNNGSEVGIYEGSVDADAEVLVGNLFDIVGSNLYYDADTAGYVTTVAAVEALADLSGNAFYNIAGTALFTNVAGYDFSLQGGSAAIDSGYTAGTVLVGIYDDIDSNFRPAAGQVDIGCYESLTDRDLDRLDDADETSQGTDDMISDSDGDGLSDGEEIFLHGTDPLSADSDGDGISDGDEVNVYGGNPRDADSDGDSIADTGDNCIAVANDQTDSDGDGDGDECDPCPLDNPNDSDADGVCDSDDPAPLDLYYCGVDTDSDLCDDCAVLGYVAWWNDGDDYDGDLLCDAGDPDADGDGFDAIGSGGKDCNDGDPAINPAATEIQYDGIDNDCSDGSPDNDLDGDGYNYPQDCSDTNPYINPGMPDIPWDNIDNNCNGSDFTPTDTNSIFVWCDNIGGGGGTGTAADPYASLDDALNNLAGRKMVLLSNCAAGDYSIATTSPVDGVGLYGGYQYLNAPSSWVLDPKTYPTVITADNAAANAIYWSGPVTDTVNTVLANMIVHGYGYSGDGPAVQSTVYVGAAQSPSIMYSDIRSPATTGSYGVNVVGAGAAPRIMSNEISLGGDSNGGEAYGVSVTATASAEIVDNKFIDGFSDDVVGVFISAESTGSSVLHNFLDFWRPSFVYNAGGSTFVGIDDLGSTNLINGNTVRYLGYISSLKAIGIEVADNTQVSNNSISLIGAGNGSSAIVAKGNADAIVNNTAVLSGGGLVAAIELIGEGAVVVNNAVTVIGENNPTAYGVYDRSAAGPNDLRFNAFATDVKNAAYYYNSQSITGYRDIGELNSGELFAENNLSLATLNVYSLWAGDSRLLPGSGLINTGTDPTAYFIPAVTPLRDAEYQPRPAIDNWDIGAFEFTGNNMVFVDANNVGGDGSYLNPYQTIAAAVAAVDASGDEDNAIIASEGSYAEEVALTSETLPAAIRIFGGWQSGSTFTVREPSLYPTIITSASGYGVNIAGGGRSNLLNGLYITGSSVYDLDGYGIYHNNGMTVVERSTIVGPSVTGSGLASYGSYGVYCEGECYLELFNCEIKGGDNIIPYESSYGIMSAGQTAGTGIGIYYSEVEGGNSNGNAYGMSLNSWSEVMFNTIKGGNSSAYNSYGVLIGNSLVAADHDNAFIVGNRIVGGETYLQGYNSYGIVDQTYYSGLSPNWLIMSNIIGAREGGFNGVGELLYSVTDGANASYIANNLFVPRYRDGSFNGLFATEFEGTSDSLVENNIFYCPPATGPAIKETAGGSINTLANNLFVDCKVIYDDQMDSYEPIGKLADVTLANTGTLNIFGNQSGSSTSLGLLNPEGYMTAPAVNSPAYDAALLPVSAAQYAYDIDYTGTFRSSTHSPGPFENRSDLNLFVSNFNGSDVDPGTAGEPLATIARALDIARAKGHRHNVFVRTDGATDYDETIAIDSDSGDPAGTIIAGGYDAADFFINFDGQLNRAQIEPTAVGASAAVILGKLIRHGTALRWLDLRNTNGGSAHNVVLTDNGASPVIQSNTIYSDGSGSHRAVELNSTSAFAAAPIVFDNVIDVVNADAGPSYAIYGYLLQTSLVGANMITLDSISGYISTIGMYFDNSNGLFLLDNRVLFDSGYIATSERDGIMIVADEMNSLIHTIERNEVYDDATLASGIAGGIRVDNSWAWLANNIVNIDGDSNNLCVGMYLGIDAETFIINNTIRVACTGNPTDSYGIWDYSASIGCLYANNIIQLGGAAMVTRGIYQSSAHTLSGVVNNNITGSPLDRVYEDSSYTFTTTDDLNATLAFASGNNGNTSSLVDTANNDLHLEVGAATPCTGAIDIAGGYDKIKADADLNSRNNSLMTIYDDGLPDVGAYEFASPTALVIGTYPADGDTNIASTAEIKVYFDRPINSGSGNFTIDGSIQGNINSNCSGIWNGGMNIMTVSCLVLVSTETITITISGDYQDMYDGTITLDGDFDRVNEGTPTDDYSFSFTIQ